MFQNSDQTVLLFAFNRTTQLGVEGLENNISCEYALNDGLIQALANPAVTARKNGYYIMSVSAEECEGLTFDLFPDCDVADIIVIAVYHNRTLVPRSRSWVNDQNEVLNFTEQLI